MGGARWHFQPMCSTRVRVCRGYRKAAPPCATHATFKIIRQDQTVSRPIIRCLRRRMLPCELPRSLVFATNRNIISSTARKRRQCETVRFQVSAEAREPSTPTRPPESTSPVECEAMGSTMDLGDDRPRRWFAVRVAPQSESAVVAALADAGLSGWAPMSTRWRGSGSARQKVTTPAFPTYVFAALPEPAADHFGIVIGLRAVKGFLGGAQPEPVSALAVSLLQMRERFGHFNFTRTRPARTVHENSLDRRAVDRLVARLDHRAAAA